MRPPRLIGITGHKGHGKGAAADRLIALGYELVKFADPLKQMVRTLLAEAGIKPDFIEEMIDGSLKEMPLTELGGATPRKIMVTLGTDWGREMIDRDLWVRLAQIKIRKLLELDADVVVDDVRFLGEAEAIRRMGGCLIRVQRTGHAIDLTHPSESEQRFINCDGLIINDGTIEDLHRKVDNIFDWEAPRG